MRGFVLGGAIFLIACTSPTAVHSQNQIQEAGRDPEIVRAQAIVDGINETTVESFTQWEERFRAWVRANPRERIGLAASLTLFATELGELRQYAKSVQKDPELGVSMREDHPRVLRLFAHIQKTNEKFFVIIREIIRVSEPSS